MAKLYAVVTDTWSRRAASVVLAVSVATAMFSQWLPSPGLSYLSVFGTLISLAGFFLAAYIATRQDKQMEALGAKSDEQKEALEKARKDLAIIERAKRFFKTEHVGKTAYICIRLENDIEGENLPFTPISEDFCLSLLTVMLQERCERKLEVVGHSFEGNIERNLSEHPEKARIFFNSTVCSRSLEGNGEMLASLPVWIREPSPPQKLQRFIWEMAVHNNLKSTHFVDGGNRYYGLMGRLSHENCYTFVMSGLSQIGTLVAGNFVHKLLTNSESEAQNELSLSPNEYKSFMGEADFLAVVVGEPTTDSREVESINCEVIWLKDGNAWQRI